MTTGYPGQAAARHTKRAAVGVRGMGAWGIMEARGAGELTYATTGCASVDTGGAPGWSSVAQKFPKSVRDAPLAQASTRKVARPAQWPDKGLVAGEISRIEATKLAHAFRNHRRHPADDGAHDAPRRLARTGGGGGGPVLRSSGRAGRGGGVLVVVVASVGR